MSTALCNVKLSPTENLPLGQPLHHFGGSHCQTSGCRHCARCGLGPQPTLYFSWTSGNTNFPPGYTEGPGLCWRCFSGEQGS